MRKPSFPLSRKRGFARLFVFLGPYKGDISKDERQGVLFGLLFCDECGGISFHPLEHCFGLALG